MKAGVYLADNLLNPKTSTSYEPIDCPFSRTFGCENEFEYLERPGNEYRLRRMGAAMHGASFLGGLSAVLSGDSFLRPSEVEILMDGFT
jgi:hypothetical protein